MATVLVAFLLVLAGGLLVLARLEPGAPDRLARLRDTHARLREAEQALVAFAMRTGRLPRPATPPDTDEGSASDGPVLVGALPVTPLGLPPRAGQDAWGRLLTYAVSATMTRPDAWTHEALGSLRVSGGLVGEQEGQDWALISHGPNGAGAFLPGGQRLPLPTNAPERDNLGRAPDPDPALFRAEPWDLDPTDPTGPGTGFDDVVRVGALPR
ncbi:hypothetical protein [Pararhodospirillum oryzae]|nr:hypothetical protein [Pararhodospirillum oryzae]